MEKRARFSLIYYIVIFSGLVLLQGLFFGADARELDYNEFLNEIAEGKVEAVVITDREITGRFKKPDAKPDAKPGEPSDHKTEIDVPSKPTPWRLRWEEVKAEQARVFVVVRLDDPNLIQTLHQSKVDFRGQVENNFFKNLFLNWVLPFGLLFVVWGFIVRRMGGGPSALNIGRNKARLVEQDPNNKTRFSDVAGVDEAIEEIKEVVDFLKTPARFTQLGAKLPKGVLLVGPPGTGKTLLAKAVAGEAGVPFFRMSGSDFVEMFVGVGASRVRDLFEEAKKKAPCIIFIDELDAIGRSRASGAGFMGGNSEQENTLNQLLVSMDGFDATSGVVLLGATNRPEVLDRALLRPGRFDRQVLVDRPTKEGRLKILQVHAQNLPLDADVSLEQVAAQTPGFVGADLANICNEAALFASRRNAERVRMVDFQDAIERVIAGAEKKGKVLSEREKRRVAVHESGHALVGYFTKGADPVQKISIVPRGQGALGYTLQSPAEEQYLKTELELVGRMRVLLAGRAAEQLVFGDISTGASDDLEKVNQLAKQILQVFGMGTGELQNLSTVVPAPPSYLGVGPSFEEVAPSLAERLSTAQRKLVSDAYQTAVELLTEKRAQLDALSSLLIEREKIDAKDLLELLGPIVPAPA
jgi:cell division protease FtsH